MNPGVQHWMAHAYVLTGRRADVERLATLHDHPLRLAVIHAALTQRRKIACEVMVARGERASLPPISPLARRHLSHWRPIS